MIIAFHKPYGVLSQFTPELPGQRTLSAYGFPKDVYPLGRLDMDSEGLLLLCDERMLNHSLLDPKYAHRRTYLVQVEGVPSISSIVKMGDGTIVLKGHRCRPCQVTLISPAPCIPPREPPVRFRKAIADSWLELSLVEGKNRQVRRMTAAAGHPTLRLIRISIGGFSGEHLQPGDWEMLDGQDRDKIFGRA